MRKKCPDAIFVFLEIPCENFSFLSKTNLDEFSFPGWGGGVPPLLQKLQKFNSAVESLGNLQLLKTRSELWGNIVRTTFASLGSVARVLQGDITSNTHGASLAVTWFCSGSPDVLENVSKAGFI